MGSTMGWSTTCWGRWWSLGSCTRPGPSGLPKVSNQEIELEYALSITNLARSVLWGRERQTSGVWKHKSSLSHLSGWFCFKLAYFVPWDIDEESSKCTGKRWNRIQTQDEAKWKNCTQTDLFLDIEKHVLLYAYIYMWIPMSTFMWNVNICKWSEHKGHHQKNNG